MNMAFEITILAGFLASTYIFLRVLLFSTQNVRESPAVATSLSLIEPLLGIIWNKTQYYVTLRYTHHVLGPCSFADLSTPIETNIIFPCSHFIYPLLEFML